MSLDISVAPLLHPSSPDLLIFTEIYTMIPPVTVVIVLTVIVKNAWWCQWDLNLQPLGLKSALKLIESTVV
jgi:hypothetical protein